MHKQILLNQIIIHVLLMFEKIVQFHQIKLRKLIEKLKTEKVGHKLITYLT